MPANRLPAIDVLRALTMFLMIFVNDLWTLSGVPAWLEHAPAGADQMGFSDIIFPAFLFIVGLSIPLAIRHRLEKGEGRREVARHIISRSAALLLMGVFHVNLEHYSPASLLPKDVWEIAITLAFFLVWLDYPKNKKRLRLLLRWLGILLLIILGILYRGHGSLDQVIWMRPWWWGILGLIGWAYLFSAFLYLFIRNKKHYFPFLLLALLLLNAYVHAGWPLLPASLHPYLRYLAFIDSTNICLVMGGVLSSEYYLAWRNKRLRLSLLYVTVAAVLLAYGLLSRPVWGISKIAGTPSWMAICFALTLFALLLLIWLVDYAGKTNWFRWMAAAGTSTLTCYLIPYLHYPLIDCWPGIRLPEAWRIGTAGILKSLLYAWVVILFVELLGRCKIKLKL